MSTDQWDEARVARWLSMSEGLDRQMAPITEALFGAAALQPGERVLDVGCGHGPTTRRAATEVGPAGSVTGIDIAGPMLHAAAGVESTAGSSPIEWVEADVCTWAAPAPVFDVVMSRFGVMFFSDPVAAFANLAAAVRPGGRLAVATWAHRHRSELFQVPLAAVVPALEAEGITPEALPVDDGAFSLGTPEAVRAVLEPAGWEDVAVEEKEVRLLVGGGASPFVAAVGSLNLGPARVLTSELSEEVRERVAEEVAESLADHVDEHGNVVLGGTILVTTAGR